MTTPFRQALQEQPNLFDSGYAPIYLGFYAIPWSIRSIWESNVTGQKLYKIYARAVWTIEPSYGTLTIEKDNMTNIQIVVFQRIVKIATTNSRAITFLAVQDSSIGDLVSQ